MNNKLLAVSLLSSSLLLAACGGTSSSASSSAASSGGISSSESSSNVSSSEVSSSDQASSSNAVSSSESSSGSSSGQNIGYKDIKWVTPTGSPTLAFYPEGSNENWVSSSSPATVVVPAFGTSTYDAIVFDGVSGLNVIKKNSFDYALAGWLSEGTFYLVSTKYATADFSAVRTVDSFVQGGNADKAFLKLAADAWKISSGNYTTTYETGVANVATNLISNNTAYDYYLVAEPVLTSATAALKKSGVTLNVIYSLQDEWKKAGYGDTIPAAGLFFNLTSWNDDAKQDQLKNFYAAVEKNLDSAVDKVSEVKGVLDAYGDSTAQKTRFGFDSTTYSNVQSSGNKFGLLKTGAVSDDMAFANAFQSAIGGAAFASSLFLKA